MNADLAAFVLWSAAALLSGAVALILYRRPKWARLEHDARLWRFAWVRARRWATRHWVTEVVVIIGASLGVMSVTDGDGLAPFVTGTLAGVVTVVAGSAVLLTYHVVVAPADLHKEQLRKRHLRHRRGTVTPRVVPAPGTTHIPDQGDTRHGRPNSTVTPVSDRTVDRQSLSIGPLDQVTVVNLSRQMQLVLHEIGADRFVAELSRPVETGESFRFEFQFPGSPIEVNATCLHVQRITSSAVPTFMAAFGFNALDGHARKAIAAFVEKQVRRQRPSAPDESLSWWSRMWAMARHRSY